MTIKATIFRACLGMQYCSFVGLIAFGIFNDDTFDSRLLLPITLVGIAASINTFALVNRQPREP